MPANSDRTYYQYKLLRKVRFPPLINTLYLLLGFAAVLAALWADDTNGIVYTLLACGIIIWLHYVTVRSTFLIDQYAYRKRWGFQWRLPWVGFFPLNQQYVGYRYWRKICLLTFIITFIIIVVLTPFVPIGLALQLLFWHIWFSAPRIYSIIAALSISEDKLIKLGTREFLIYKA